MLRLLLRVAFVCLPLALVAASCGDQRPAEEVDCAPTIRYEDTLLTQGAFTLERDLPPRAGTLQVSDACSGARQTVETRRGVPPSVALFPEGPDEIDRSRAEIYVANDALGSVRGHPLHRAVYGSDAKPDLISGRACAPISFRAKAVNVDFGQLLVDRDGRDVVVRADAGTLVNGPVIDGVPRIPKGSRLRIAAVRCEGSPRLVARRLTVL